MLFHRLGWWTHRGIEQVANLLVRKQDWRREHDCAARNANAYFDRTQVGLGAAAWDDCALTVLARVVSRPARDRIILDSGSKTLTNDGARLRADAGSPGRPARSRLSGTRSVTDYRTSVRGTRERPRDERRQSALDPHPRPRHPESFARRVEPRGRDLARGRYARDLAAACRGARPDRLNHSYSVRRCRCATPSLSTSPNRTRVSLRECQRIFLRLTA
jgi:hypothetical protein